MGRERQQLWRRRRRHRCGWLIGVTHDRGTGEATARCVELLLNAHRLSLMTEDGYIDCWLRQGDADMEDNDAVPLTHREEMDWCHLE